MASEGKPSGTHAEHARIERYSSAVLLVELQRLRISTAGSDEERRDRLHKHVDSRHRVEKAAAKQAARRAAESGSTGPAFFCVIDFEATCEAEKRFNFANEIIEFPAVLLDGQTCEEIATFHSYVRPVIRPVLSDYCVSLTGIEQATVDASDDFLTVLNRFEAWLRTFNILDGRTVEFVTDGPWDLRDFMRKQCVISGIARPPYFYEWINLRKYFELVTGKWVKLSDMLAHFGMTFEGREHSGLADSRNAARVFRELALLKAPGINDSMSKQATYFARERQEGLLDAWMQDLNEAKASRLALQSEASLSASSHHPCSSPLASASSPASSSSPKRASK